METSWRSKDIFCASEEKFIIKKRCETQVIKLSKCKINIFINRKAKVYLRGQSVYLHRKQASINSRGVLIVLWQKYILALAKISFKFF